MDKKILLGFLLLFGSFVYTEGSYPKETPSLQPNMNFLSLESSSSPYSQCKNLNPPPHKDKYLYYYYPDHPDFPYPYYPFYQYYPYYPYYYTYDYYRNNSRAHEGGHCDHHEQRFQRGRGPDGHRGSHDRHHG